MPDRLTIRRPTVQEITLRKGSEVDSPLFGDATQFDRANPLALLIICRLLWMTDEQISEYHEFWALWRDSEPKRRALAAKYLNPEIEVKQLARLYGPQKKTILRYPEVRRLSIANRKTNNIHRLNDEDFRDQ